jgi:NAD(P)-dependent dehydrogenase (short-subunit alcohol dehydrogenase family)
MTATPFRLDGRIALVTGGTRGIGEAIALAFAQAGARVIVSSRKPEGVEKTVATIREAGGEVFGIAANVGREGEADALAEKAVATWGGIDILVNNAAANPVHGPVVNTSNDAFDKIIDVNLKAPFELARKLHGVMKARGGGSVINISSVGGVSPEEGLGIYSVSKAALISLTKVMAKEWGPDGIRANAICPGLIQTRFSAALWQNDDLTTRWLSQQAIPRIGQPEDVASCALYLASDASSYCTGGVYMVDGGYSI